MQELMAHLDKRIEELKKITLKCAGSLAAAPAGRLVVENRRYGPVYFVSGEKEGARRRYIRRAERRLAGELAQKDYDARTLRLAEDEIRHLESAQRLLGGISPEEAFGMTDPVRRSLITPWCYSDAEYLRRWEEEEYSHKEYGDSEIEIYTLRGERVRSKSEKIIADLLKEKGIPYRYEAALYLPSIGRIIYPDFTLPDVRRRRNIYLEHLGLMDNAEYSAAAIRRIAGYEADGYYLGETLFITYEIAGMPLNTRVLERKLDMMLLTQASRDRSAR